MAQESRLSIVIDSRNAQVDAEKLEQTLRDLESAGVRVTRSNTDTSGSMNRMASASDAAASSIKRGLIAALGGLSAMAVIDVADEWGQYASRIRMATKSTEEYEHVQKRMVKSAQATYRAINETRESFIQMSPVLRDMGLSLDQSIDAVDTFSGLLVVNGANAQRGAAAMEALAKSLQRGRIDAQAWMTIYSTVDNVVDLIAESTGKSAEEIRRLGIDGKISAEMIATALVQGNAQVLKALESMPTTVRDALQNINTAFGEYIGRTNETYQVTATLAEGLDLLGNNIDSVLNVAIVAAGAGLTAYSAKTTLALVETGKLTAAKIAEAAASRNSAIATEIYAKARLAEAQATVASATGMQRLTLVQTALIPAQRQLEAATKAVTVANRGLGASLLGLVGGPIGGITLAAGLAATAFLALRDSTEESKFSFDTLGESLDETIKKFRELNTAQREAALIQVERELESQAKELEDAYTKLIAKLHEVNGLRSDWSQDEWIDFRQRVVEAKEAGEDLLPLLLEMRETSGINPRFISDVIILNGGIDAARDKFGLFSERAAELKGELEGAASAQDALNDSLKGLSDADFTKLLSGLQQSLDVIGMTSQQAAEYKARLEGANEEQARQAGFWANLIDIAQKLEGATKEKDAAAIKGAQELLNKLAEQEVQLRMNMARAAEYAAMMALGVEATLAAQGAETAAQLVGLKAQEEIVARIKAVTENISTNTQSSSRKAAEAAKKLADEVDNLVGSLYPAIQAEKEWVKSQKLLDQALKQGKITQEQHAKGLVKIREQYDLIAFTVPDHVKAIQDEARSLKASIPSLRQRVDVFGLSAAAIARNAEAETRARIATLNNIKAVELAKGASAEYVKQIEQEIAAMEDLLIQQEHMTGLVSQQERLEAEHKYYQDVADEAKRTHEEIEKSLMDALMRGFEGGKDFAKNALDTIKNMFNTLVLRPLIQPVVAGAAGMITGVLGFGGAANAQGLGGGVDPITGLSAAKNLMGGMSWFTDFTGTMGGSLMDAGMYLQKFDGIVGDFGNTILGNIDTIAGAAQIAGAAWNYGKGIYDLTKGNYGAGIGAIGGQLLGGPIGGMIGNALGGMLDKAFKGETRAGAYMQYDLAAKQAVVKGGPSGGYGGQATIDAATQLFGSTVDTINAVLEGVGAQAQAAAFHGMFESSEKGRGGTFSGGSLQLADGTLVDFGTNKKGAGFGGKSGTAEEMFQNLQAEVHFAALEAWKAVGSEMPAMISDMLSGMDIRALSAEQAQAAVAEITGIVGSVNALTVALNQLPMLNLQELTFDAKASLNELFGGIDNFIGANTSYLQNFYSDAERHELAVKNLGVSLAGVGLEMPVLTGSADELRAVWRELVETQDLETAAGREAYATLMLTAGAFSEIADYAGEAAAGLTDMTDILREREALERQIMQLQGDTAGLRALELAALDESNHGLQEHIWFLQEEAEAAQRAAEVGRERYGLETQLLQLQGDTATLRARQLAGLDASNHALQEQIWALQDQSSAAQEAAKTQKSFWDSLVSGAQTAYNDLSVAISAERSAIQKEADRIAKSLSLSISAASDSVRSLDSLASQLSSTVSGMMKSGLNDARNRAWAQERVSRALSVATLTGVMPEGEDFEAALRLVAEPSEGLFNSFEDYQADFLRTAHEVDALRLLADDQLTVERRTLKTLEDQLAQSQGWRDAEMSRLDAQLEHWREQIDIASGTYRATLSVSAAVDGVQRAIASLHKSLAPESSLASYDTGTSFVPHDMTANIHRGEIIIDPQSSNILRRYGIGVQGASGGSDAEVKLLRQEIRELRVMLERKLTDIDQNTYDTARSNRHMSEQPQSVVVTNVVPTVNAVIGE